MQSAKPVVARKISTSNSSSHGNTEEITTALESVTIKSPAESTSPRGNAVQLSVSLDGEASQSSTSRPHISDHVATSSTIHPVRKLVRRDSMERREALLKGKEGSRQRRRWENGITWLLKIINHCY